MCSVHGHCESMAPFMLTSHRTEEGGSGDGGTVLDKRAELRALARDMTREQVESGMQVAGFAVFRCPLKEQTKPSMTQILDAGHQVSCQCFNSCHQLPALAHPGSRQVCMITGDNPLTAIHVSRELELVNREPIILMLTEHGGILLVIVRRLTFFAGD